MQSYFQKQAQKRRNISTFIILPLIVGLIGFMIHNYIQTRSNNTEIPISNNATLLEDTRNPFLSIPEEFGSNKLYFNGNERLPNTVVFGDTIDIILNTEDYSYQSAIVYAEVVEDESNTIYYITPDPIPIEGTDRWIIPWDTSEVVQEFPALKFARRTKRDKPDGTRYILANIYELTDTPGDTKEFLNTSPVLVESLRSDSFSFE